MGSGARAAGERTRGKRCSPGSGGALRLPFCRRPGCEGRHAPARAPVGRESARDPRRGHRGKGASAGVSPCPSGAIEGFRPFPPAQVLCSPSPLPPPMFLTPLSVLLTLEPDSWPESHCYPGATMLGKLTRAASPAPLPGLEGRDCASCSSPIRGPLRVLCRFILAPSPP